MTGFPPSLQGTFLILVLTVFSLTSVVGCNKGVRSIDGLDRNVQSDNDRDDDDDRPDPPDDNDPNPDPQPDDDDRPDPPDGEPDPEPEDDRPDPPDDINDGFDAVGDDEGNLILIAHRPESEDFEGLPTMCFSYGYIRDMDRFDDGDQNELGHWVEGSRYCATGYRTLLLVLDTDGPIEAVRWSVEFSNRDGKTRFGCEGFRENMTQYADAEAFYGPRPGDTERLDVQLYSATWVVERGGRLFGDQGCGYVATVDGRDFPEFVQIPGPGDTGP